MYACMRGREAVFKCFIPSCFVLGQAAHHRRHWCIGLQVSNPAGMDVPSYVFMYVFLFVCVYVCMHVCAYILYEWMYHMHVRRNTFIFILYIKNTLGIIPCLSEWAPSR